MKKYNIIIVAVMLLLAAGVFYYTKDIPEEMYGGLGPGEWPRFITVLLLVFSVILLIQTVFGKSDSPSPLNFKSKGLKRVFILLGIVIIFGIIMPVLGFLISSLLFIIAVMVVMDDKNKIRIALSSIGITLFIYVFFEYLLKVILPRPFFL